MSAAADEHWRQRQEARWAAADAMGAIPVEDIPLPWRHHWGTVIRLEFPADRPNVVDVVFSDETKFAETKGARYMKRIDDVWDYPPSGGL
jgi:hypothetical protein